jgi:uncharacterized protein
MLRRVALVLSFLWFPFTAHAEPYPHPSDSYVTDIAGVISAEAEVRLRSMLRTLRADTGVEATVVTIPTRSAYDPPSTSLEGFATGLFNDWGIGNAERNDGIMLLVIPDDHETRLELGSGYDQGYDVLAQDIVSRWLVPAFRAGDYSDAIETGMQAVADRIARRHAARLAPEALPARPGETFEHLGSWIIGLVFAGIAVFAVFGRRIGDLAVGLKRCPDCGRRGLSRSRSTLVHAGPGVPGAARIVTACRHCDHREEREERIGGPKRSSNDGGGGFGGGKSSGGGASGRW